MKDKESQLAELSRQYWEALEEMDYINPNFCESPLHMMGEKPLKKDEKTSNSACIVWQFCYNTTMTEREKELTKLRIEKLKKAYAENPNLVTFMEIKIYEKRLKKDEEKACNSTKTML